MPSDDFRSERIHMGHASIPRVLYSLQRPTCVTAGGRGGAQNTIPLILVANVILASHRVYGRGHTHLLSLWGWHFIHFSHLQTRQLPWSPSSGWWIHPDSSRWPVIVWFINHKIILLFKLVRCKTTQSISWIDKKIFQKMMFLSGHHCAKF